MIKAIVTGVTSAVSGITGAIKGRQEVKMAGITAEAKIKEARLDNEYKLELSERELEAIDKKNQAGTWKDEYSLVLGSSPYPLIIVGSILAAFGHGEFLDGTSSAFGTLRDIGVPVGEITVASIAAGLGVSVTRLVTRR